MPCCRDGEAAHAERTVEKVKWFDKKVNILYCWPPVSYAILPKSALPPSMANGAARGLESNAVTATPDLSTVGCINFPLQELHCPLIVELWKYSMIHSDTAFVDQEGSPHIFHIVNGIQNLQREGITFPCKGYQKYFHYASMLAFLLDILSNSWKTLYTLPYELHKSNIIFFQTLHIIAIWNPLADHSHKLHFF